MDFTEFRFVRSAPQRAVAEREKLTLVDVVREPETGYDADGSENDGPHLSEELLTYLRLLQTEPGMPVTVRDKKHGYRPRQSVRIREELGHLELIDETSVSTGRHGRNFKDTRLTARGEAVLRVAEAENRPETDGKQRETDLTRHNPRKLTIIFDD